MVHAPKLFQHLEGVNNRDFNQPFIITIVNWCSTGVMKILRRRRYT